MVAVPTRSSAVAKPPLMLVTTPQLAAPPRLLVPFTFGAILVNISDSAGVPLRAWQGHPCAYALYISCILVTSPAIGNHHIPARPAHGPSASQCNTAAAVSRGSLCFGFRMSPLRRHPTDSARRCARHALRAAVPHALLLRCCFGTPLRVCFLQSLARARSCLVTHVLYHTAKTLSPAVLPVRNKRARLYPLPADRHACFVRTAALYLYPAATTACCIVGGSAVAAVGVCSVAIVAVHASSRFLANISPPPRPKPC